MNTQSQNKRKNNSLYLVPRLQEKTFIEKSRSTEIAPVFPYLELIPVVPESLNDFSSSIISDAGLPPQQEGISQIYRQPALSYGNYTVPRLWRDLAESSQEVEDCQEALTMNPNSIEADHLWDSIVQQRTKLLEAQTSTSCTSQNRSPSERLVSAINRYRYQAQLHPDSAIVQTNLGKLYHKNHQWQEAICCYKKAIAIDSNYSPAHQYLAQIANRKEKYSDSEAKNQQNQVDFYFKLAQTQIQEGRLREAQICYQQVIKSEPNNWQAYYSLGNLLAHHRQWERALDSYQKVMQFQESFSWAYHNAGNVCLELELWQKAKEYYQSAIKLNPYFSWSYYNLGEATSNIQQWQQALSAYQEAEKLQPEIKMIKEKIAFSIDQLSFSIKH